MSQTMCFGRDRSGTVLSNHSPRTPTMSRAATAPSRNICMPQRIRTIAPHTSGVHPPKRGQWKRKSTIRWSSRPPNHPPCLSASPSGLRILSPKARSSCEICGSLTKRKDEKELAKREEEEKELAGYTAHHTPQPGAPADVSYGNDTRAVMVQHPQASPPPPCRKYTRWPLELPKRSIGKTSTS
jgi:hypothetical protein